MNNVIFNKIIFMTVAIDSKFRKIEWKLTSLCSCF
jgi:hypothetical protein